MTDNTHNRRAFHRIFFEAPVRAITSDTIYQATLIDISLNGALISKPADCTLAIDNNVRLEIDLGESHLLIAMETTVSHIENDHIGLKREQIDMESISHLRRLVELNLGDNDMLNRDIEHLIKPD